MPHKFTVQNQQQRETLRFSNLIGNAGAGDLRLHPESNITTGITTGFQDLLDAAGNVVSSQPVSEFVFHPAHNHWHITDVALFEIRVGVGQRDGRQLRRGVREPVHQDHLLPDRLDQARGQLADGRPQLLGLQPGRAAGHLGRLGRPVPPQPRGPGARDHRAKPGVYYLVSIANPRGNFIETDKTNNTAWTSFRLTRDSKGNAKIAEISHSPCSARQCGEDLQNR